MNRSLSPHFTALLLILGLATAARAADSPASRLFNASDFPLLARGVSLPAGDYTVKAWASSKQSWSLSDGEVLRLSASDKPGDVPPSWQSLGKVSVSADKPLSITVAGPEAKDSKSKSAPPSSVPALLSLSTDPDFVPNLDLIRSRTDTLEPPRDPRRTTVRTNQEGANFYPPDSARAWRDRAKAVRERLLVTLGLWPMPPKTPLNAKVYGKIEHDGYTIEKVVLETLPGFTLAGNLYRPVGKTGKLPGILCPHGHAVDGRVQPDAQMRCIRWAKLGCVVFLYDMVGYNDSKSFGHAFFNRNLDRWGYSLTTLQTWDSIRALDWLTSLPDVDASRIGCTGESGGGTQTFLLTAIDDRIAVSAPVVMVSDSFQGGCVCENAPGLRLGTDNVEFAALAAPRPLKLVGATGDWTKLTMTNMYPPIREVYRVVGVPERISAEVFDFPHNYNQTSRNAVYAFMGRWLLNITDPSTTREGPQTPEKPEDLLAFNDKSPPPPGLKTPAQLERELIDVLGRQIDKLAPGEDAVAWDAARNFLKTSLKVRVGLTNPQPSSLTSREVRSSNHDGYSVSHALVGRASTREEIPVVRLTPKSASGRLTVIMDPRGKAALAGPDGKPSLLVKALLDRGQSVVGFDPLLIGESVDPNAPATRRPDTAHFETYNPSLAADRLQDLATVLAWARSQGDVIEVSVVGLGRSAPLVLLARPALEGIARTAVDLDGFDEDAGSGADDVHMPGWHQFGGLKAAAALASPAPLRLIRPSRNFASAWPTKAYALDDASGMLRLDSERPDDAELARWIDSGE